MYVDPWWESLEIKIILEPEDVSVTGIIDFFISNWVNMTFER